MSIKNMRKVDLKDILSDPTTYITTPGYMTVNLQTFVPSVHDGITPGGLPLLLAHGTDTTESTSTTTGALTLAGGLGVAGNVNVGGYVNPSVYLPGQVINMAIIGGGGLGVTTTATIAQTNSYVNFATYSYTPKSASSAIIVEFFASYAASGSLNDTYNAQINVNGSEIGYSTTSFVGTNNGRVSTLFPLTGVYVNNSITAKTLAIAARRNGADDNITVYGGGQMFMKITEVGV